MVINRRRDYKKFEGNERRGLVFRVVARAYERATTTRRNRPSAWAYDEISLHTRRAVRDIETSRLLHGLFIGDWRPFSCGFTARVRQYSPAQSSAKRVSKFSTSRRFIANGYTGKRGGGLASTSSALPSRFSFSFTGRLLFIPRDI